MGIHARAGAKFYSKVYLTFLQENKRVEGDSMQRAF